MRQLSSKFSLCYLLYVISLGSLIITGRFKWAGDFWATYDQVGRAGGRADSKTVAQHISTKGVFSIGEEFVDVHNYKRLYCSDEAEATCWTLTDKVHPTGSHQSLAFSLDSKHTEFEPRADSLRSGQL